MKIERIVGQKMARLRTAKDWSQPELGRAIGDLLRTKPWSRQAVSSAENGQRAFTVADLVAIACVLETSPAALLTLPPTAEKIEVGEASIPREDLENPTWTHESTSEAIGDVIEVVRQLEDGLSRLQDVAEPLWSMSSALTSAGIMLQGRVRLEEAGAARPGDYGYE